MGASCSPNSNLFEAAVHDPDLPFGELGVPAELLEADRLRTQVPNRQV